MNTSNTSNPSTDAFDVGYSMAEQSLARENPFEVGTEDYDLYEAGYSRFEAEVLASPPPEYPVCNIADRFACNCGC